MVESIGCSRLSLDTAKYESSTKAPPLLCRKTVPSGFDITRSCNGAMGYQDKT
jgi:hypothetical protein